MDRKLNHELARDAAQRAGFTFTKLAQTVGVSVESVSKWLNGEAVPRPGKALKLGRALGLSYEELFGARDMSSAPKVAFRLTANRVASTAHHERACEMGKMYEQLVPYLPFSAFEAPTQLKNPELDRNYLESLCQNIRRELGVGPEDVIPLKDLFGYLSHRLQAVVVPVFWGHRGGKAELAAHIYSPTTRTTWIPFNLDTKVWDARFWVAHELAHALTFTTLSDEEGERFADAFAGTLVMPESLVKRVYEQANGARLKRVRLQFTIEAARKAHISPICIAKQVDRYAAERGVAPLNLETPQLYPAVNALLSREPTVGSELFPEGPPSVAKLCEVASYYMATPFFEALSKYLKEHGGNPSFVQGLLDCSLVDAKALNSELA
jgi:transcriptional regulator with XRE-family HTH domain